MLAAALVVVASMLSVELGLSVALLVTVVVLSAIVPTAIAQRWFSPSLDVELERGGADAAGPLPSIPPATTSRS
jgi:hypothetical protein